MEKLKYLSFSEGNGQFNISVNLTGGGAAATFYQGSSDGEAIKALEKLVENLKQGVLTRALQ